MIAAAGVVLRQRLIVFILTFARIWSIIYKDRNAYDTAFALALFRTVCGIFININGPVVQWIERETSNLLMLVRFQPGPPKNMNKKLIKVAASHSVLVLAYVVIVVSIMNNAEKLFGPEENAWAPVAFLMLFVLSAAIMGTLIFMKPVIMYMEGSKKEAVALLSYILGCLVILTVLVLVVVASL